MIYSYCSFIFASFLLCCCTAELYITTVPEGTHLSKKVSTINSNEVSHMLTYLMGLSGGSESSWPGVSSVDLFNRPKANLFISITVPNGIKFALKKYDMKYEVTGVNALELSSLEESNVAIAQLYKDQKPVVVYIEANGQLYNIAKVNAPMLDDLPLTLEAVKSRLMEKPSILDMLPADSCLKLSRDSDVYFLGELQTMDDILSKLLNDRNLAEDAAPDSYVFSLTTLQHLALLHGEESCQLKTAIQLLEEFVPTFIDRFNQLYNGRLLSEVNVLAPIGRSFHDAAIRHTRSLEASSNDTTDNSTIGNMHEFLPIDYAVTVNLTFWVTVVFALATLATSYGIWFMNPGWDSVIYRMTTQRMKFD